MHLQSLEIVGFKSFAAKTILEFHPGVTAIVGPNGCGKSNVLDAVRWVLGEQSAKALRGGEMADVIFGGTDSRQALGMAEVSLTFTGCEAELGVEWNEVRITRRVFRDGKSEYFINKAPCRLRDIHQLFMDTGVGRSAYSIMEQGKIDQILSSRPEDRRAIFEEAAGITKYKAQKKEALRKLEYTEANLVRVSDIIKEVKRQIGSLQRQAAKARRYQALMDSLRVLDTHLTGRNYALLSDEINQMKVDMGQMDEAKQVHESEMGAQEIELVELRSQLGMVDQQVVGVRDQVQSLRGRVIAAEGRIESHGHRCEEFSQMIERNRSDIAAAESKTHEQENQIQQTDCQIEELLSALRAGEQALQQQEEQVRGVRGERQRLEQELTVAQQEKSRLEGESARLNTEISSMKGHQEASEARFVRTQEEAQASEAILSEVTARVMMTSERIESLKNSVARATEEVEAAKVRLQAIEHESRGVEAEKAQLERRLAELSSKRDVLLQLEAAGEGLGEATQAILRGLDNAAFFQPAIVGAIASLVDVEPQYADAIEAALGEGLQAVLVKDADVAESMLMTLAHHDFGRGRIIPRDWILARSEGSVRALPEGSIAWAKECVRCGEDLMPFVSQALADVVIVADLETAFRLRRAHSGFNFVTLRGELVGRDGTALAGKSGTTATSALLRKRQIAELDAEIASVQELLHAVLLRVDEMASAREASEAALSEGREELQRYQVELTTTQSEINLLVRQQQEAEARLSRLHQEAEQVRQSVEQATQRYLQLESQLGGLNQSISAAQARCEAMVAELASVREREAEVSEQLNELRIRVATERQQRENLQRQREPMAARLQELAELMRQRGNDICGYEQRIETLRRESEELQAGIEVWNVELEQGEEQVGALLAQRSEIQESVSSLEVALSSARKQLHELQERRGKLEVRTTQIDLRLESLREHVARRYGIDLAAFEPDRYALLSTLKENKLLESPQKIADAVEGAFENIGEQGEVVVTPEQEIPWERIEATVAELTERLDSMGPVNLEAIQEFEELEQRHVFLEQQFTDLTNSKSELLDVIAKINTTTKQLFADTFEKIRVNFQEMFKELFGGGRANLVLADESDPLESGIEIIAKPPGKQLQSISLLSGGERTMTAVSLLFSIYMVKPSPFCVLDEMDAPLDESNISRFIKILDRFVDQSQFIVITHNKRTISRADMLYGVTMEEHGVSKLVSVKFRNKDEAASRGAATQSVAESFGKSGNLHSEEVTGAREEGKSMIADAIANTDDGKNLDVDKDDVLVGV